MESIKIKSAKGVMWSAIDRFSSQIIQFIVSIVIARVLSPSDYGLIAMLGIFLALAQTLVDSGFSNALIQKKDASEVDFSTVFFCNLIISLIIYIVLYLLAPYIALFFNNYNLALITKIVGLNFIVQAISIVPRTRLTISLNFKIQAIISLISIIISSLVAILMAYNSWGVWSLVAQSLSYNTSNAILLWMFNRKKILYTFSKESFVVMFNFGSKLLLSNILHTIYLHLYSLVIGKKFSSTEAGLFTQSLNFTHLFSVHIMGVISRAIYPIQCRIQDDEEKLSKSFLAYLRMTCYIIFPIAISLCMIAKQFVIVFLTDKWLPMVSLLQILCIAYMWYPIMVVNNQILNVKGRSDYFLKAEIIKKIVAIILIFLSLSWGLIGVCVCTILYSWIDIYIITIFSYKIIKIDIFKQIREILPILALSMSLGIIIYMSNFISTNPFIQLIFSTIIGLSYFIFMSIILKIKEFDFIVLFCKNIFLTQRQN
jgi:O-antigen/teichoic acid export membrane protein